MVIKTITVLEPTSKAKIKEIEMVSRPSNLEGDVIGFLWNDKPNANFLLERFAELLTDNLKLAEVMHCHKFSTAEAAPEEIINELSRKCNAVVIASGDCGSCTSFVMYDAVELEKRGTPTVSVCTDEFSALGRTEAEALGFPYLAILEIPHPLGGVNMKVTRAKADHAIDALLELLTMPIEELKEQAKRQVDFWGNTRSNEVT